MAEQRVERAGRCPRAYVANWPPNGASFSVERVSSVITGTKISSGVHAAPRWNAPVMDLGDQRARLNIFADCWLAKRKPSHLLD